MRYGLPYKGSKSGIAEWVVDNLPSADTLVDLMCGGGAVTHAAMLNGKFKRFVMNDVTEMALLFSDAAMGEYSGYSHVPDREQFNEEKYCDIAVSVLYSFGNNREDYLWSRELEPVKVAAERMLVAPSLHERRMEYMKFIKALAKYGKQPKEKSSGGEYDMQWLQGLERLERLQCLEGLERLEMMQGLINLERLEVHQLDYREVSVPYNSTVYCDPPYRGTRCDSYAGFDVDAFDEWLASVPFLVVVSEYTCPYGCVEVASREKTVLSESNGNSRKAVERLFVQERFLDEYNDRMRDGRLF